MLLQLSLLLLSLSLSLLLSVLLSLFLLWLLFLLLLSILLFWLLLFIGYIKQMYNKLNLERSWCRIFTRSEFCRWHGRHVLNVSTGFKVVHDFFNLISVCSCKICFPHHFDTLSLPLSYFSFYSTFFFFL